MKNLFYNPCIQYQNLASNCQIYKNPPLTNYTESDPDENEQTDQLIIPEVTGDRRCSTFERWDGEDPMINAMKTIDAGDVATRECNLVASAGLSEDQKESRAQALLGHEELLM